MPVSDLNQHQRQDFLVKGWVGQSLFQKSLHKNQWSLFRNKVFRPLYRW